MPRKSDAERLRSILIAALKHQVANLGTEDEFYICYTYGGQKGGLPSWVVRAKKELARVTEILARREKTS